MTHTDLATFTTAAREMVRSNDLARLFAAWGSSVPMQREGSA
jgi:hypothetical protein